MHIAHAAPQWFGSVLMLASQPSVGTRLQSPKPATHSPLPQTPGVPTPPGGTQVAFATFVRIGQTGAVQDPQWETSVERLKHMPEQ